MRELNQSTAFGPFINRHHFAGYMELTIALPLGLLFAGAVDREKIILYLFIAGLMGVALVMTGSRGGIVSLVAEIFFLVTVTAIWRKPSDRRRTKSGRLKTYRRKSRNGDGAVGWSVYRRRACLVASFRSIVLSTQSTPMILRPAARTSGQ